MDVTRDHRRAFLSVCKHGSVTLAARDLGLTQAALSIRLKRLEEILSCSLLVRKKTGVILTEAGQRFLEHAMTFDKWEEAWWNEYKNENKGLSGEIRIGAFSTIGRSLVLPALSPLLKTHSEIDFQYSIKELRELPHQLLSGEVDIIFLDRPLLKERTESVLLGYEEYVYVRSKKNAHNPHTFLNHDEQDEMSYRWFKAVEKSSTIQKRRYLDEIYSVIDGVAMGIGVSILPKHLIENDKRIEIQFESKKMLSPVYIIYHRKNFYPKSFELALETLVKNLKANLKQ
jgi:DNA-binding transcriptional LysR family regulator